MQRLLARPHRFQFFQAVRLIALWQRRGPARALPLERVLRFKNSLSLGFPPSQIEALSYDAERFYLTPAFVGFLGVRGVLPYHYTEAIAAQVHFDRNEGARAFLDCFSQRGMLLFYRAWEKCRVEYRTNNDGGDGFLAVQLALAGARPERGPAAVIDASIGDEVLSRYAALVRHRPVSGETIAGVLMAYFGLPFRLEQFAGAWEDLPPGEQACPGRRHCRLGADMMLGPRYWRRDLGVRLWVGPLARVDYDRFFARAGGGKALRALLALFAVANLRVDVRLILRAADAAPARLDGDTALDRGAFLLSRPSEKDQDQAGYALRF
jgi:type VI secretion system protein ImpH